MKLIQILADIICNTLLDPEALDRSRNRKGVFTRNCGKLPYWTLIKLLLKNVKKTIFIMPPKFFNLKAKLIYNIMYFSANIFLLLFYYYFTNMH